MWFRMAEGCGGITVERQEFVAEVTDDDGHKYFRAPNHFAPRILALKGFEQKEPPGGLEDLPQPDPLRDGAIAQLTKDTEAMKLEIANLRTDLTAATARIAALVNERDGLKQQLEAAKLKIDALEEDLEDKPAPAIAEKKK